jgi:hypothetical protein
MHDRHLQRASMEHQERPGATIDTAIKIVADWSEDAIDLENEHISRLFGLRGRDWNKRAQFLVFREGRRFDRILIDAGGRSESIYFDISTVFRVTASTEEEDH